MKTFQFYLSSEEHKVNQVDPLDTDVAVEQHDWESSQPIIGVWIAGVAWGVAIVSFVLLWLWFLSTCR